MLVARNIIGHLPCHEPRSTGSLRSEALSNTVTLVENIADSIRAARERLGLSTRELAHLSGVSYPNISRIENGRSNPRWDTLVRLARALGNDLAVVAPRRPTHSLASLILDRPADAPAQIDWTALRAFADGLALRPETTAAAIHERPMPSGSHLLDNLLAGVAEKSAHDADIRPPAWTASVPPLREPWTAPGTPRLQQLTRDATPREFASRNIFLSASAIWRDREMALA